MYSLLKAYARFVIRIYCKKVIVNRPAILKMEGPLLLAANHPNSFLDGIILTTLFDHQIYALARGDAFQHPLINKLLRSMHLLPVYRTSEGVHNLGHNYTTFDACRKTFANDGIVLIFSEGRCENEWHLRPLKKGTARLAVSAWQNGIPLRVLPLGINYSSFKKFGKEVHLNFGEIISADIIELHATDGKQLVDFNSNLNEQLGKLVYEIADNDYKTRQRIFSIKKDFSFYAFLIPALAGFILHAPFFFICKMITELSFKKSGHYDSVQTSLLMLGYPFYWLLLVIAFSYYGWIYSALLMILLPVTAWFAVQVKYRADW